MSHRLRTSVPLALSTACGLAASALMFALPGEAAPLPTTYGATTSGDVWQVDQLDLDLSGDPAAMELSIARVDGVVGSENTPRSHAEADNLAGASADNETIRRGAVSNATATHDTAAAMAGQAPAGTLPDVVVLDTATLSARGRWVGDTSCLPEAERLTDSRASITGSRLVASAIPGEDPQATIPIVDIPVPQPTPEEPLPPLPDPELPPIDIPGFPTPTGTPTLSTELPTLPTTIPTLLPTDLPTTLLPTISGFPRVPSDPSAAGDPVSMAEVEAAAIEQHTWLEKKTGTEDVRAVRSEVIGTMVNATEPAVTFFGGEIAVRMASQPRLAAYADGVTAGRVTWTPPALTLLVSGQASPLTVPADGTPVSVNYSGNRQVVLSVAAGQLEDEVEQADGTLASGEASALHFTVTNGDSVALEGDLFPMSVEATSPLGGVECRVADTDGDGLTDDVEATLGTNPDKKDTDGDRLGDGTEVNKYRTNPLKKDTDRDKLDDRREVKKLKTNPRKPDTDKDRLKDGAEVKKYKTNPRKADTDKDGLKDGAEVRKYDTNPRKKDTDGDGVSDGREVRRGTDPTGRN